jgi:hypothetical protein
LAVSTHQQWAELLRAISGPRPASDAGLLLRQAVELGRDVAPDTVGCSVTTIEGESYHTPVFSDALALDLDRAQYEAGDGPCMAAAREQRHEYFDSMTDGGRFPGFTEAAVERGVRSSISLPLAAIERPAAINLYASSRYAFDAERPRAVAGLLARCVSALMTPADGARQALDAPVSASKIEAARSRARLIAEAEAALMARRSVSRTDALSLLIRRSRAEARSIFDVAREVVGTGEAGFAL